MALFGRNYLLYRLEYPDDYRGRTSYQHAHVMADHPYRRAIDAIRLGMSYRAEIEKLKISSFLLFLAFAKLNAQESLLILDSATRLPLVDVSVGISNRNLIFHSDIDGKIDRVQIQPSDQIVISRLGYEKKYYNGTNIPYNILLSLKSYQLPETKIFPISPRDYLKTAFDSFYKNHLPYAFSQNVFYREEFINGENYLRFQELNILMSQYPKPKESRPYYKSNSLPEIKQIYRLDNYKEMTDIKSKLGKLIGSRINFNQFSLYSYVKGVNILNLLFTNLLDNPSTQLSFGAAERLYGVDALHIVGKHHIDQSHFMTSHTFLHPESKAVMSFYFEATSDDVTRDFEKAIQVRPDFKTRAAMWFLGVKYRVRKFYMKVIFTQNSEGVWIVSDHMTTFPFIFQKRKYTIEGTIRMSYKYDQKVEKLKAINSPSFIYGQNQIKLEEYQPSVRFAPVLKYAIPLTPIQKERLQRTMMN